jgi:hypothetical protein
VDAGRFHHQCFPTQISYESNGLPSEILKKLDGQTKQSGRKSIGWVNAIK